MNSKLILLSTLCFLIISCREKKVFHVVKPDNPVYIANTAFASYENLSKSKFQELKDKYHLDTIFQGEKDELKRILLLRNWIHKTIKIDDYGPYAGNGSVESILDEALQGHGFHCGHFTAVQNAILNAYGYVTRCVLADTGVPVDYMVGGGHHAINEVWLNTYHKWFLSDAKYDYHFEKNARLPALRTASGGGPDGQGIPLSALEIRDEYLKNKAADINLVKGPERIPISGLPEYNIKSKEQIARVYTWLSWDKDNNRYTSWPDNSSDIIMYKDEYFKTHTWLWDGKPHWAYNTKFLHLVSDREKIEWTPNTIVSKVLIAENKAKIELNSNTPNLKTYQMKIMPEGDPIAIGWKDVSNTAEIELRKNSTEIAFRAINFAGITGPEHKVFIKRGL